jgi:hypothetical protein
MATSITTVIRASRIIRKSVLVVPEPAYAGPVLQELVKVGWTITTIEARADLARQNPDSLGCLLLDGDRKPLAEEVLAWCEKTEIWRWFPKVLIGSATAPYTNLLQISRADVEKKLVGHLMAAQYELHPPPASGSERRSSYRHKCNTPINIQLIATLIDISGGGVALELPFTLPIGMKVGIHISDTDPLLDILEAEVVRNNRRNVVESVSHLRFTDLTPAIQKALQRHLLSLQMRRLA